MLVVPRGCSCMPGYRMVRQSTAWLGTPAPARTHIRSLRRAVTTAACGFITSPYNTPVHLIRRARQQRGLWAISANGLPANENKIAPTGSSGLIILNVASKPCEQVPGDQDAPSRCCRPCLWHWPVFARACSTRIICGDRVPSHFLRAALGISGD